jgi:Secretion system C-terminal sorting domain
MKRLLFLIVLFSPLFVNAQAYIYHPFPTNDGCWNYEYFDDFHNPTGMYSNYSLFGDTTIASVNYKKISGSSSFSGYESGAIRESGRIIYYLPDTSSTEVVLYNFNLTAGDTVFNPYGGAVCSNDTLIVQSVDSILLSDGYHKQINLGFVSWIEGVGSTFYLLKPCQVLCVSGNDNLQCMIGNSVGIYLNGTCLSCGPLSVNKHNIFSDFSISPNPFTTQTTFSFDEAQTNMTIKIIDITGKEIKKINFTGMQFTIDKGEMKSGIYFVQTTDEKKNVCNKKLIIL